MSEIKMQTGISKIEAATGSGPIYACCILTGEDDIVILRDKSATRPPAELE